MNLEKLSRLRKSAGKLAALLIVVFILAAFDGIISTFGRPPNLYEMLPGGASKINGYLAEDVGDIGELVYTSSSDRIQLTFEAVHRGFWLGGQMWRGVVEVSPGIDPGEYTLVVVRKGSEPQKNQAPFTIRVYSSAEEMRQAARSVITRYFGFSPWAVMAASLLPILATFLIVFLLSRSMDKALALQGKAVVYMAMPRQDDGGGFNIAFGLGTAHGVKTGDHLTLLDKAGAPVGSVEVLQVMNDDSIALAGPGSGVEPGFFVRRADLNG